MQKTCVCGESIPQRWTLCKNCLQKYGSDRDAWPPWLRFMVADIKRERRAEQRHADMLSFEEIGDVSSEDATVIA